ncbi:MAG: DinB family protein [Acidobacteriota bacterium]|nr:DinB family protein [Acidobacteriota bacterium]
MSEARYNSQPALTESTLVRLRTQLDSLDAILAGANEGTLGRRPADGKWSAREHLAHLGRYHEVFLERLDRMLSEDRPQLGRYRTEDDPGAGAWFRLPTREVIERMRKLRVRLVERVTKLRPDEFDRIGVHPAFGEMTLGLWLEFFLVHEGHHLYAILKLAREEKKPS